MATANDPNGVTDVNIKLTVMTNLLTEQMYANFVRESPWSNAMIDQRPWEDGRGDVGRINVFGASGINPVWTPVGAASTSEDIALNLMQTGGTEYSFRREEMTITSERLDLTQVRMAWQFEKQVANVVEQLVATVGYTWQDRYRNQYTDNSSFKCVLTANGIVGFNPAQDISSFPEIVPAGALTEGIMTECHNKLDREGAGKGAAGKADGANIYSVFADPDVINFLLRGPGQDKNWNTRQDIRFTEATMGEKSDLYKALGATTSYRGFTYLTDTLAARWDFDNTKPVGQKWIRIDPYIMEATTTGVRRIPNPLYDSAPFVDTAIYCKDVFKSLVPSSLSTIGRSNYLPQNYAGEVFWVNNKDMGTNVLGTQGMFMARLSNGAMPVYPRHGLVIRTARAIADSTIVDRTGNPIGSILGGIGANGSINAQNAGL